MCHDLAEVVRVQGVEDVEEVVPWWALTFWVLVGEVLHHGGVLGELGIQGLDGELFVLRHPDLLDLRLLEQVLLAREDLLEKVLVDHRLRREVELEAVLKGQVVNRGDRGFG